MKLNPLMIMKIGGTVLSLAGMVVTGIANSKANNQLIEKLVEQHLNK